MSPLPARIDAEPETVGHDLGRLVLTIVELLRQLMERQAIRRVEAGDLAVSGHPHAVDDTVDACGTSSCLNPRCPRAMRVTPSGQGPPRPDSCHVPERDLVSIAPPAVDLAGQNGGVHQHEPARRGSKTRAAG